MMYRTYFDTILYFACFVYKYVYSIISQKLKFADAFVFIDFLCTWFDRISIYFIEVCENCSLISMKGKQTCTMHYTKKFDIYMLYFMLPKEFRIDRSDINPRDA